MLESLCYEGECIVSSRVVVTRAFKKRIFRLNFGYNALVLFGFFRCIIGSSSRRFPAIRSSINALETARKVPQKQG